FSLNVSTTSVWICADPNYGFSPNAVGARAISERRLRGNFGQPPRGQPPAAERRNRPFVERAKTDGAPRPRYRGSPSRPGRSYLPAPPSPASTNGAQTYGWANSGGFFGSSIAISARRSATARPIVGSFFSSSKAPNLTVATEATDQCDTRIDRAPA